MKLIAVLSVFIFSMTTYAQSEWKVNFPTSSEKVVNPPDKNKVWVFFLAGQSNMAGRGFVEPADTLSNPRILTINSENELVYAKEPLHWYEPTLTGLDCGVSFATKLLSGIPSEVSILLIPTAIGGSSISQWINNELYRGVKLFSNFEEKVSIAREYGQIKGILWHQGESDAKPERIHAHERNLSILMSAFRESIKKPELPIILGQLGSYSDNNKHWQAINQQIISYVKKDACAYLINTQDLSEKGDKIHFDSVSQREMGKRFAEVYLSIKQ